MPDNVPQPGWVYKPGDNPSPEANTKHSAPSPTEQAPPKAADTMSGSQESVSWTASEYVAHHKNLGWYALFLMGISACSGLIYIFTRDLVSVVVISIAGVLFAIVAGRKPKELPYKVDIGGVTIDGKFYPYTQFKFFSIVQDGAIGCINFWPLKRFMPELSIYYPPDQMGKIVGIISEHLPHEEHEEHAVDKLLKKLRF